MLEQSPELQISFSVMYKIYIQNNYTISEAFTFTNRCNIHSNKNNNNAIQVRKQHNNYNNNNTKCNLLEKN